jgi:hypothetical protein
MRTDPVLLYTHISGVVGLNMDNTAMLKSGKITEVQAREVSP